MTGFHLRSWLPNPQNVTLLDKQLVVLAKGSGPHAPINRPLVPASSDELYQQRCNYVRKWQDIHHFLSEQARTFSRTFNFGSISWTWLLAGYCPEYWRNVDVCVIDQFAGDCLDKSVKPLSEVSMGPGDALTLGVNPVTQDSYARRFQSDGWRIVRWDNYVQA
jgi:hypothetical protein